MNDVKRFTNSRPLRPGSEDFAVSGVWPGVKSALNVIILNLCLFTPLPQSLLNKQCTAE